MKSTVLISLIFILSACNQGITDSINRLDCGNITLTDFQTFLNISPTVGEKELKNILGKSTGGTYNNDKTTFIHEFEGTKRVPIKVYVNANSGTIETIFMEILGLNKNFDKDVKKAKADYPIDDCHLSLFGKQPKEVIEIFGQAYKDNLKKDNVEEDVRVLQYNSDDGKTIVTFNFYPSQSYRLSSIVVDWF